MTPIVPYERQNQCLYNTMYTFSKESDSRNEPELCYCLLEEMKLSDDMISLPT